MQREEVTITEAAAAQRVDRSTIMRIRTVAKNGTLAALAASKPGVRARERDYELEMAKAEMESATQSPAYGPLLAALHAAETRGFDVSTALPTLITARGLGDAEDVAAVLHERVDRWVATAGADRPARDRSIIGLIARADGVADLDMRRALDERAHAIERPAAVLVD